MRARRDQVQAYKFVTRRIVAAMLSGEPETTDRPMRRLGFSVFASSMVAVLGMAGFGIWGVVTGQASDLEDNTLVIEKGSHARYAYVDGLLHPVSNIASAYLLFGTHEPEVRELPSDELVGIARGPELGIVGAPDGVPGADQLIDLPWSVCTVPPTVDSPDPQTTVVVGGELPGGTPLGEQGFYITANDQSYLLWNDRILPIAHDVVPVVLRLSAVRPTPVGTPFINATVAGPALTIVTPRSFLEPVGVDIGGEPAQAGFIYFTAGQHYMMTVDGLRPVGELTVALRTSLGAVVRDITGSAVRDHLDTSEPLEPAGYPQQVPELHPANGASPTICTVYRGPSDAGPATSIMVFESTPEPLAGTGSMVTLRQSTGDAAPASDRMLIPPGRGVLAQAASLDGTASPSATLYLITSDGYKYPLGAEGAREALGYGGGVEPVPVPETILAVIPTGPTLDVASAQTVAGSAPEPTTAGSAPESSLRRNRRPPPRPATAGRARRGAAELRPTAFVEPTVAALLADDAAVAAYEVAAGARSLAELDVTVLRQLRDALKEQRYLAYATRVARAAVQRAGSPRDLRARRRLEGEIAVVSGAFTPRVAPDPHYRSRPGRILHLVGRGLPDQLSGYTVRTQHTAAAQRAASWDATVVTQMGVHREHDQDVVVDGVTYHRLPGPPRRAVPLDEWFQGHVDRLAELVTKERPALLHAHSDFLNARAAIALKDAFGIPVVYECRGFWEETWLSTSAMRFHWDISQLATDGALPDWYTWRRSAEAAAAGSVDTVVTLDRVMVDHLASRGVPTERIATVPNAVDPALFPVPVRDRARAAQLGIAPDEIVIGYVSSLTDYEGVDVLISAFAQVSASAAGPVTLLVVGDGPARDRLAGMADMYPSARIIFTGAVPTDRVLEYYSLIDIFVVPRPPVPVAHLVTPLKPFEAFSTGRVVVLANVRALASIAEQSGAAVLFEAGDAASLATTLLGLLDDPGERRRLSEIGAGWVRTAHTWQHNAERYAVIYRNLGVNAAGVNASPVARTVASRSLSPPA